MLNDKHVLGIIPARGGSKRLPRKNLLNLAGRPMITYTIEAGLQSAFIDELLVSTDDLEIAGISSAWGAQVPFMRPSALAKDESSTFEVIQHAIDYYKEEKEKEFEYIILLQPTSPLRDCTEIDRAMMLFQSKEADAVISVSECDHSPLWCNTLPDTLAMDKFLSEDIKNKRSQELDKYYRLNGAIYICRISSLMEQKTLFLQDNIFAFLMPREKSVDVDTMLDLMMCETILQNNCSIDAIHD
jgi:CMP-N-acetylneuraminic acid synthetase